LGDGACLLFSVLAAGAGVGLVPGFGSPLCSLPGSFWFGCCGGGGGSLLSSTGGRFFPAGSWVGAGGGFFGGLFAGGTAAEWDVWREIALSSSSATATYLQALLKAMTALVDEATNSYTCK